jgi:lipoteichoic acid synthase
MLLPGGGDWATMSESHMRPFRRYVVEFAPCLAVLLLMWGKLICFSLLLPGEWWEQGDSLPRLVRLAPDLGEAIRANPHLLSATLGCLLILAAPILLLPRGLRVVGLLVQNFLVTSLALAQLVHFRFDAELFSLVDLPALRMLRSVASSVFNFLGPSDFAFYLDVALGLVLLPVYLWRWRSVPSLPRNARWAPALGLLGAGLLVSIPSASLVAQGARGMAAYGTLRIEVASSLGILPYHVVDVLHTLDAGRPKIGEADYHRVRRFLDDSRRGHDGPSDLFGRARGRNVIIVSGESLQAFPIGLRVNGQPVTPRLSELLRESLYFENFHDQTYLGSTTDAEFATLQSLHPLSTGLVIYKHPGNRYRGLPRILAERGYSTLAMAGAPSDFWSMDRVHPQYGFQHGLYEEQLQVSERIGPWMSDRDFYSQVVPVLERASSPFMAFLLSSSNHQPYELPEHHRTLRLGGLEGTLLGQYLHSVHYFDAAFGEFVDQLREAGLLDTSILVLYGDHQGFLNDPPELADLLGFSRRAEYEYLVTRKRVPLLVRLPHGEGAGLRATAGGHVDVAPTILALLGIADERALMPAGTSHATRTRWWSFGMAASPTAATTSLVAWVRPRTQCAMRPGRARSRGASI